MSPKSPDQMIFYRDQSGWVQRIHAQNHVHIIHTLYTSNTHSHFLPEGDTKCHPIPMT